MPDGPYGQWRIQVQHTPTVVATEPLELNMSPSEHKSHVSITGGKNLLSEILPYMGVRQPQQTQEHNAI
jgi:hypothetical protein